MPTESTVRIVRATDEVSLQRALDQSQVSIVQVGKKRGAFSVATQFTVSTGKRSELPRGMPLVTRVFASSEHAWDPMASSSVNFCRKRAPCRAPLRAGVEGAGAVVVGVTGADGGTMAAAVMPVPLVLRGVVSAVAEFMVRIARTSRKARTFSVA